MKLFSQSFLYDDSWSIVSLAFFLRYPNPFASHVVSCDVIARSSTTSGTLLTTRLILKRGALPKWAPRGIVSRAESWVIEQSEVDPYGREVRCITKNLDHVKVMQVHELTTLQEASEGKTLQTTRARFVSAFGWGLTKRIENHGLSRFKANVQRSREGVALVMRILRESRLQPIALGMPEGTSLAAFHNSFDGHARSESWSTSHLDQNASVSGEQASTQTSNNPRTWSHVKTWTGKG